MNENIIMFSVLGAVLAVTIAGLYMTTESNQVTGLQASDIGSFNNVLLQSINFLWSIDTTSGNVGPGSNNVIGWNTENTCLGDASPCTAALFNALVGAITGNEPIDFYLYVDNPSPFIGPGDAITAKTSYAPPLGPGCNSLEAYGTLGTELAPTVAGQQIPVGLTTVTVDLGVTGVSVADNSPGPTTVLATGTVTPTGGICG